MRDWTRRIYFAASISGGREDREVYLQIAEELAAFGEVLPEEVSSLDTDEAGEAESATRIHRRELQRIERADMLVAEVTRPSFGVGYQVRYAEEKNKPILALYRPGKAVSAMLVGSGTQYEAYRTIKEIPSTIRLFMRSHELL